jgi:secreted trypsin-like serine protease
MSANKVIRDPLWPTLVGALVAAMVVACFVFVQSGEAKQVADKQSPDASITPYIVGGTQVPSGKHRFVAYIEFKMRNLPPGGAMICAGSLIDRDSVLTAAHCFFDEWGVFSATAAELVVGETNLSPNQNQIQGQIRRVVMAKSSVHPRFDLQRDTAYDVAVLKLDRAVNGIQPLALATAKQNYLERPGRILTVAGWGDTSENDPVQHYRMREVSVPVVSDSRARQAYTSLLPFRSLRYFPSLMVAAGEKGKDSCQGDSGGPLFASGGLIQVGITSLGHGCGRASYPGIYTEVNNPKIRNFILAAARR